MFDDPKDPIMIEMLRRLHLDEEAFQRQFEASTRRGRTAPVIPPANRYPRSIARSELEASLQPWNRSRLGSSGQLGAYR